MPKRRVVVEGGGKNLYEIYESGGKYTARQVTVNLGSDSYATIGTASTLNDAVTLIRAHSGREVKELGPPL